MDTEPRSGIIRESVDLQRLGAIAESQRDSFSKALPYPHVIIDDFLPEEVVEAVLAEFRL